MTICRLDVPVRRSCSLRLPMLFAAAALVAGAGAAQQPNRLASSDSAQGQADDDSTSFSHVSADGRWVVFASDASNLTFGDTNGHADVFVKDFGTGLTDRISIGPMGVQANDRCAEPRISPDGRWVVYTSKASTLSPLDGNHRYDVYLADRQLQTTTLVSQNWMGVVGSGDSTWPSVSDDGRYVAFSSTSSNLLPTGDVNGYVDVFVRDMVTGVMQLCSRTPAGATGNGASRNPRISGNGQFVVFDSFADDLVAGDSNGHRDVFVFDRSTDQVWRASLGPGAVQANGDCTANDIDRFGSRIVYESWADNLAPGVAGLNVYAGSPIGASVECVNVDDQGALGNDASFRGAVSGDGRFVVFTTRASDLFAGDGNDAEDIAVRDLLLGTTRRASFSAAGGSPNGWSQWPTISDDGRFVAFTSPAPNVIFGKQFSRDDVVRTDRFPTVVAAAAVIGAGCPGSAGVSTLQPAAGSLPWLGATLRLEGANVPDWLGLFCIGFSGTSWNGAPLPLLLDGVGMPGCTLYTSLDVTSFLVADANGDYAFELAIVDDPTLRGIELFFQSWLLDAPANPFGGIMSDAVAATIGG